MQHAVPDTRPSQSKRAPHAKYNLLHEGGVTHGSGVRYRMIKNSGSISSKGLHERKPWRIFYKKILYKNGLPFESRFQSKETVENPKIGLYTSTSNAAGSNLPFHNIGNKLESGRFFPNSAPKIEEKHDEQAHWHI